uniref:Uncharacterized protein n=1 Tax=candidate division CPR3 bacterium TaxID=2268181 RepID=A0A7V3N4A5_UNCC3
MKVRAVLRKLNGVPAENRDVVLVVKEISGDKLYVDSSDSRGEVQFEIEKGKEVVLIVNGIFINSFIIGDKENLVYYVSRM